MGFNFVCSLASAAFRRTAAVLVLLTSLGLLASAAQAQPGPVKEIRMASAISFSSFDPLFATAPTVDYLRPVYDTLVVRRGIDRFEPGLATEWHYRDENRVLTLVLRAGVRFFDGEPFNADAVRANFERGQAQAGSPWATFYQALKEVRTPDRHTVELVLSEPNPALIEYLTVNPGMMVSPKALEDPDRLTFNPVGTGGWELDSAKSIRGDRYTYQRNDAYWNPAEQPVHTIFIREMRDAAARVNALRSRQVDIAAIDPDQADVLRKLSFGIVPTNIVMRMVGVWDAHGTEVAALREPKVRQAIRMAINREAILKALFANYGTAGLNFYPAGVPGHSDRLDDLRAHDVEAAKELMAEAGYRSGFEVNTVVLAHHARVAEVLAGELAKIGVRLEITVMPDAGSYFAAVRQKKAPLGIFAHQTALPLGMYHSLMSPSGRYNPFNIVDDKLDALAQEAARAEPQEAQQLYANLFYLMVGEQALVFPVVNMEILAALAPGIHFPEPTYTDAGLPNPRYLSFSPDADLPRF